MGADLIGYMVKGPVRLDDIWRTPAVEHGADVIQAWTELSSLLGQYLEAGSPERTPIESIVALGDLQAQLEELVEHPHLAINLPSTENKNWLDTWINIASEKEWLAGIDPKTLVDDLYSAWNQGQSYRDMTGSIFVHRDSQFQVVFAGERSWGDEPTGGGYQLFKALDTLNLFPILHLET